MKSPRKLSINLDHVGIESYSCGDPLIHHLERFRNSNISTVMAMAISYNWLFLWDYTFYKWSFVGILITGITRAKKLYRETKITWPPCTVPRVYGLFGASRCFKGFPKRQTES